MAETPSRLSFLSGAPQRELRLVVDGVCSWCAALTTPGENAGQLGLITGTAGAGQGEVLAAIRTVCDKLGISALGVRASQGVSAPPLITADLARQIFREASVSAPSRPAASEATEPAAAEIAAGSISALSSQVETELAGFVGSMREGVLTERLPQIAPRYRRLRLVDSLARSLLELSARRPIVLTIENIHCAESLLQEVIRHLLRLLWQRRGDSQRARVLLILSAESTVKWRDILSSAGVDMDIDGLKEFEFAMRGYSRADLRREARRLLECEVSTEAREKILRLTHGNVRHIHWMCTDARERGDTGLKSGRASKRSLPRLVARRFGRLDSRKKDLVVALALLGRPSSPSMLAWLLGLVRPSSPGSELEASDADSAQALTAPTEATTGSSDEDASAVDAAPEVDEARANDVPDDAPFEDAKRVSTSSAVDATPLLGFEAQEALDDLCADGWCLRTPGQGDEAQDFVIADGEIAELALAQLRPRVLRRRRRQLAQQLAPLGPVGAGRVEFFLIACRLFLEAGDGKEAARVALAGAEVLEQVSCYMEALELIEGVVLVSLVRDPADRRALREIQVRLLDATGNHREAVEATSELFREGREGAVYYRRLRGDSYGKLGEVEKQIREYEAAAEQLGGMSCSTAELGLLANLGKAYLAQGDVERATKCLEQCLDRLPEDSEAVEEEAADIFELAASLKREKREFAGALEIVSGLVRKASTQDDRSLEIEKIRQKAELLVALGQGHAAKDSLRDALDVAGKTGSRWLVAEQLVALGRFWLDSGNPSAALAYTEQAYGIFQDVGREEEAQALRVLLFTLELELGFLSRARVNITAFARRWVESRVPALSVTRPSWMTDADGRRRELRRIEKVAAKRPESLVVEDYRLCVDLLEDEGKLDAALQMCRERLHSEGIGADSDSRLALYLSLGRILTLQGDTRAALRYLEKGSLAASDDGSEELLVRFSAAASEVFLRRGELARSFDAAVRGLRIAHREPRAETLVPVLLCVADFLMETGVLDVACDCAETAFLLARADGFQRWEVAAALRAGQIHRALGRRAESLERLADAETLIERLGLPVDDCRLKLERAWQSFDAGNYTDASRLARQGLEIARPLQLTPLLAEFLFFLGVLSGERRNSRRNFPRALEFLDQALGLADSLESSRMRWETLELGANLHQERGNSELAEEYSSRAEEILWEAFGGLPDSLKGLGFRSRLGERDKPRSPTLAV